MLSGSGFLYDCFGVPMGRWLKRLAFRHGIGRKVDVVDQKVFFGTSELWCLSGPFIESASSRRSKNLSRSRRGSFNSPWAVSYGGKC